MKDFEIDSDEEGLEVIEAHGPERKSKALKKLFGSDVDFSRPSSELFEQLLSPKRKIPKRPSSKHPVVKKRKKKKPTKRPKITFKREEKEREEEEQREARKKRLAREKEKEETRKRQAEFEKKVKREEEERRKKEQQAEDVKTLQKLREEIAESVKITFEALSAEDVIKQYDKRARLGKNPSCKQLVRAMRKTLFLYHPDKYGNDMSLKEQAKHHELYININEAYEKLKEKCKNE